METHGRTFIPAAGKDWLLPLYDPFLRLLGAAAIKRPLIDQAAIQPGCRVLDIGCGTGSLTVDIKRLHPLAEVTGVDPDPKALAIATRKANQAGVSVTFDQGFGDRLAYADASFDRVFSSLMFHHLTRDEKLATLAEVRRVLKPGGSLHLLDFCPPRGTMARVAAHLFHRTAHAHDNIDGGVPAFMSEAGLTGAEEVSHRATLVGSIACYRAGKR